MLCIGHVDQNYFIKGRLASSTLEESLETASEPDNNAEGIWDRMQEADLVTEDFSFRKYVDGDADPIIRETITKSSIINSIYLALLVMIKFIQVNTSSYRAFKKLQYSPSFRIAIQLFFVRTNNKREHK